jgi:hypothetical protein
MHTICGFPVPEEEQTRGFCYAQYCNDCAEKKQQEADTSDPPAPPPQKVKKKRPPRPDVTYHDVPGEGATDWVFPSDKPQYVAPFLEFMRFIHNNKAYAKGDTFTQAELLQIKPKQVLAFLTYKAFGKTKRGPQDKPTFGRSNHIKNLKMKISYFMPSGSSWVDLPDGSGHGNPTQHKTINKLIADIVQFETRGEGADSRDVRDMTIAEFEKEMELFRAYSVDPICVYRNPLIGIYQFHFITRADDVCNFKLSDPKSHSQFEEFALAQSVRWSKNVRDSRNCPDQLLLASMDYKTCIFIALALWLEYFLSNHPEAEFMMTHAVPPANATKEQHERFTKTISKTYRNRLVSVVFKDAEFKAIYKGNDPRPLGLHSKRKMGSTQAKRRGSPGDHVDHRGRWVAKKGSRIVNSVYIDPEDMYADASVASNLCLGGPIKYKVKEAVATYITTEWLSHHVVPSIARRYSNDLQLIRNLGLATLFAMLDTEAHEHLAVNLFATVAVKEAYDALPVENKPEQPVIRVPLHVYRIGEETLIDEVWTSGASNGANTQDNQDNQDNRGNNNNNNVGDNLARVPASGGNAATQQVLQTMLIQNQQLQRSIQEMENRVELRDQANRSWLEDRFRRLNDNIRRFGGTIQGGLLRQDPNRQAAVRRYRNETPAPATALFRTRTGRRATAWPTLSPNISCLMSLWTEYEFGIGGRKPAKNWTAAERGNQKQKQTYYRRNCIWKIQLHLINKGHRIEAANAIIRSTYGERTSITNISKLIVRDRSEYKANGGLHPNLV